MRRFELGDAVAHPPPVDLELGLARAAPADAAGQPRERVVAPDQPRVEVLELGQLDLQLAVRRLGPLREDVEDQLGAVEDLEGGGVGDVDGLRRRQVGVEDDEVGHELHGAEQDVLELALADEGARVGIAAHLHRRVDDLDAGGARQLPELRERGLGLGARLPLAAHADQDGPLAPAGAAHRRGAGELLLEAPAARRPRRSRGRAPTARARPSRARPAGFSGQQVGQVDLAGKAVLLDLEGGHRVEPQQREVGVVVAGERLAAQVGVHEPQAAQAVGSGASAPDVGERELAGVADHDPLHVALAVEQHADLTVRLPGDLGEVARQLGRDDLSGVDAAAVGAAECVQLALLQPERVAVDLFHEVRGAYRPGGRGATRFGSLGQDPSPPE